MKDGMIVGLGSGSTVEYAIKELARRVRDGLRIRAIPSSNRTSELANAFHIPLTGFDEVSRIDVTIDGADEVDRQFSLIKGGGGALLREKVLIFSSETVVIVVDSSKLVEELGHFPLPLEVIPFAWRQVSRHLEDRGLPTTLRMAGDRPYQTDNGCCILDCQACAIKDPDLLDSQLKKIPGVVETGIFTDIVDILIVGDEGGAEVRRNVRDRPGSETGFFTSIPPTFP